MSDDAKKWRGLEAQLRKALRLAPPTPAEADAEMETAEGVPMSPEEIQQLVDRAVRGEAPAQDLDADYSWLEWVTDANSTEFVFNRNRLGAAGEDAAHGGHVRRRLEKAEDVAEELAMSMGIKAPIDPFAIATTEAPVLRVKMDDYGDQFDGQLEFDRLHREFLMLVNTKYDKAWRRTGHHPRTRFSAAHELGHYFLEHHRARLLRGGDPQPSHADFTSELVLEREADHFASALLMPRAQFMKMGKRSKAGLPAIKGLADCFQTSLTSTAIRFVKLSSNSIVLIKWNAEGFGWKWLSDAAYSAGYRKTIEETKNVPRDSATGRVLAGDSAVGQIVERGTTAASWFPFVSHSGSQNPVLHEQAISLGEFGAITVLLPLGGGF